MRRCLPLLLCLLVLAGPVLATESPGITFYLQLIRGSDSGTPPVEGAKPVGPRLSQRLHKVLKWKRYWELKRDSVTLKAGEKVRKRMSQRREVELARPSAEQMEIRIYREAKLTRSERQPVSTRFCIVGGDNPDSECWFIVVRRDPPPLPEKE